MDTADNLVLKARIYRLFSRLLDYPYDEDLPRIETTIKDIRELLESLDQRYHAVSDRLAEALKAFKEELGKLGVDEFQASYVSTFELGIPKPPCPPYESSYMRPQEVGDASFIEAPGAQASPLYGEVKGTLSILSSLTALYEESGVKVTRASPDHVSVELEFASYLLESIATGRSDENKVLEARYRELLEKHLAIWIPRLAGCLARKSRLRTYFHLAEALSSYIRAELDYVRSRL